MKKLDRELGLFSVFAISTGAMLGPGIFVLPGLAHTIGGPAVILAYTTAGLLVIPAALNMAEMSTSLPESGGPYLFLDRSLGPMAGTLTGLGTWISLILKSAFSLVGLGAYLLFFTGLPNYLAVEVALGIAIFLIGLNAFGAKKAGQVQTVLVLVTMFVLIDFVGWGSIEVRRSHYHPFFEQGMFGFFGAMAFVFVSYAGIAKVVSVAEEIKNPSRNIPWGISLSLVVMILIYSLVVYVIVGVVPADQLGHGMNKLMPLVQAGKELGGYWGMEIMSGIAVLALASMANAGLMAASRFPLPLARDQILPRVLSKISPTFSTPFISILLTGTIMILFISTLPVKSLAKLASAFLLVVFGLINLAVIVFRESEIEWYDPDFQAPMYPFLQLFGFLTCLVLIGFMGWFPLGGAATLLVGCLIWYYVYARPRVDREGAFFKSSIDEKDEVQIFQSARSSRSKKGESVIVPFFGLEDQDMIQVERRIRLAAALCGSDERLDVVDFVEVPEQSFLSGFDPEPEAFSALEQRVQVLENEISNEIHLDQVVTHSSRGALRNYAEDEQPHWVVFDWQEPSTWSVLIGTWTWWLENFPCDTLFFEDRDKPELKDIIVLTEPGPYDGEVVYAADHIAQYFDGEVTFMNPLIRYSRRALEFVDSYQDELQELCDAPSNARSVSPDEWVDAVVERSTEADLILVGGLTNDSYEGFNAKTSADEIISRAECSVARVRSNIRSPHSVLKEKETLDELFFEYIDSDSSIGRLSVVDKTELFEAIAEDFPANSAETEEIEKALWNREHRQNTYLDDGIAIPHGFLESMDETRIKIYVLESPVTYSEDGEEASIIPVVLGPPDDRGNQLKLLGNLSREFVKSDLKEKLQNAEDPSEVLWSYNDDGNDDQ